MCHTGNAYSRTGLTTLTYTLTRSFCVTLHALTDITCTSVYQPFSQYYPRVCYMSDPEKMVTPNSLAWQTCAISLPSIFIFGIVLLKLPSCAKLIIISLDCSELIFMSFCSVHLAATSTDSCITDTSFLSHISNNVLSPTYLYNGTVVLKSFM